MIESDGRDRNDGQDRCGDARCNHPCREWSIDKALHPSPTREQRVGPKSNRREMITVNRAPDHFRDHVISGAESDRAEPKKEQIIRVPPADSRLHHALERDDEEHSLISVVKPWKPEIRAQQIPMNDVNRIGATNT